MLRSTIRPFVWTQVGDCLYTSAWYDNWSEMGPLDNIVTPRDIRNAGFTVNAKVADISVN